MRAPAFTGQHTEKFCNCRHNLSKNVDQLHKNRDHNFKNRLCQRQKGGFQPSDRRTGCIILHDRLAKPAAQLREATGNERKYQRALKKSADPVPKLGHTLFNARRRLGHAFGRTARICDLFRERSGLFFCIVKCRCLLDHLVGHAGIFCIKRLDRLVLLGKSRLLLFQLRGNGSLPLLRSDKLSWVNRNSAGRYLRQLRCLGFQRPNCIFGLLRGCFCRVQLCFDPALFSSAFVQVSLDLFDGFCDLIQLFLSLFCISIDRNNNLAVRHSFTTLCLLWCPDPPRGK